jgi:hypothetical protein
MLKFGSLLGALTALSFCATPSIGSTVSASASTGIQFNAIGGYDLAGNIYSESDARSYLTLSGASGYSTSVRVTTRSGTASNLNFSREYVITNNSADVFVDWRALGFTSTFLSVDIDDTALGVYGYVVFSSITSGDDSDSIDGMGEYFCTNNNVNDPDFNFDCFGFSS